jgi:hypothetical protein
MVIEIIENVPDLLAISYHSKTKYRRQNSRAPGYHRVRLQRRPIPPRAGDNDAQSVVIFTILMQNVMDTG